MSDLGLKARSLCVHTNISLKIPIAKSGDPMAMSSAGSWQHPLRTRRLCTLFRGLSFVLASLNDGLKLSHIEE